MPDPIPASSPVCSQHDLPPPLAAPAAPAIVTALPAPSCLCKIPMVGARCWSHTLPLLSLHLLRTPLIYLPMVVCMSKATLPCVASHPLLLLSSDTLCPCVIPLPQPVSFPGLHIPVRLFFYQCRSAVIGVLTIFGCPPDVSDSLTHICIHYALSRT